MLSAVGGLLELAQLILVVHVGGSLVLETLDVLGIKAQLHGGQPCTWPAAEHFFR